MKKIAIIFLELIVSYYMISSCSCLKSENLLKSNSFNKFESLHQKKYATARERVKREKIFKQNAQQVDLMNEKARSEKSFLFFETNKFSDLTPIEFVKLHTGYRHLPVNQTSAKKVQLPVGANKTLQGSDDFFDWTFIPGMVGPVKNQGQCGSCWAFAAAAVTETYQARTNGGLTQLSEQELIDCETKSYGCDGGYPFYALAFEEVNGAETEDAYPYVARKEWCQLDSNQVVVQPRSIGYTHSEQDMIWILKEYGPMIFTINANPLQSYSRGILSINDCPTSPINHAVTLVGYGNENGVDYWRIKNSWGDWGEEGYFRLTRNENTCGLNTYESYLIIS